LINDPTDFIAMTLHTARADACDYSVIYRSFFVVSKKVCGWNYEVLEDLS